jgi:Ricin-type beta-trefoil lectin domain
VLLRNGIGKCLNVEAGAARNGTRLIGYACDMNDRNEMFYMQPDGTIRALSPASNFCVDAAAPAGDGNQVQIWTCKGTQNQRWRYDGGQLRSFNNKCVDLKNGQLWLPIGEPAGDPVGLQWPK